MAYAPPLQRYQSGDHVGVWRGYQDGFENDHGMAMEVARATMRRVRRNAELLAAGLSALGWHSLSGAPVSLRRSQPLPGQADAEAITGTILPAALLAFWEEVGGLDFVWDYNRKETCPDLFGGISIFLLDPLCIDPPKLPFDVEMWKDMMEDAGGNRPTSFNLDLAPDDYHKANISGGSPYGIVLPGHPIDPMFACDHFSMRFTTYLRLAFRWGGFPGLAFLPRTAEIDGRVAELTTGMEPF